MIQEEALLDKYRSAGVRTANELLLRQRDALLLIADCERYGFVILGMDFYRQDGAGLVPMLNSADYSALADDVDAVAKTAHAARQLIKDRLPDGANWVSFVLDTQDANRSAASSRLG